MTIATIVERMDGDCYGRLVSVWDYNGEIPKGLSVDYKDIRFVILWDDGKVGLATRRDMEDINQGICPWAEEVYMAERYVASTKVESGEVRYPQMDRADTP